MWTNALCKKGSVYQRTKLRMEVTNLKDTHIERRSRVLYDWDPPHSLLSDATFRKSNQNLTGKVNSTSTQYKEAANFPKCWKFLSFRHEATIGRLLWAAKRILELKFITSFLCFIKIWILKCKKKLETKILPEEAGSGCMKSVGTNPQNHAKSCIPKGCQWKLYYNFTCRM